MKQTKIIMGMPLTVEIVDQDINVDIFKEVFNYFRWVDQKFSPFKKNSKVSQINSGKLPVEEAGEELRQILLMAQETKDETDGYFDVWHKGKLDPSGIVKGWAINKAADLLTKRGHKNFYVEAGGDIQTRGYRGQGSGNSQQKWKVGIRNPFNVKEIVKVVGLSGEGIATSGTYVRGQHIYNPFAEKPITDIVSLTVIGPNVLEADRFATAAFAMGKEGINFIEKTKGLEGYMIDSKGTATYTTGFGKYVI